MKDAKNNTSIVEEFKLIQQEFEIWKENVQRQITAAKLANDKWLSVEDLIEYLPDNTARATIYGWVAQEKIPYHKYGKKLTFLKSEIDAWLFYGFEDEKKAKRLKRQKFITYGNTL